MMSSEEKYTSSNKNLLNGESNLIKSVFSEGLILDNSTQRTKSNVFSILMAVLFGQLLSLLCVGNGYFSQYIQNERKIVTPLLLNSCYYILIWILYGIIILKLKIKKPKLIYVILSVLDIQANYINIFIFSFAKFEYPYIINVLSSMWSVLFTLILIKKYKYLKNHIFGIAICLVGVFLLFLGTFESFSDFLKMFNDFNNNLKGLLLSILFNYIDVYLKIIPIKLKFP